MTQVLKKHFFGHLELQTCSLHHDEDVISNRIRFFYFLVGGVSKKKQKLADRVGCVLTEDSQTSSQRRRRETRVSQK